MRIFLKPDQMIPVWVRTLFIITDSVIFTALLLIPFSIPFRFKDRFGIMLPIGLCIFALTFMIRKKRITAEKKKGEEKRERQRRIDALYLLDDSELSAMTGHKRFMLIRKEHTDRYDVLEAIRRNADAIGLSVRNNELTELISLYRPEMVVYDFDELIGIIMPDQKADTKTGDMKKHYFLNRLNKYHILGAVLLIASFLLHYKIYFRMLSCICMIIAFSSDVLKNRNRKNKMPIFLDKSGCR